MVEMKCTCRYEEVEEGELRPLPWQGRRYSCGPGLHGTSDFGDYARDDRCATYTILLDKYTSPGYLIARLRLNRV